MQSLAYITLDLQDVNAAVVVSAKQNDRLSRTITAQLRDGGVAWVPGSGVAAAIRYRKPDGTAGFYDTREDSSAAYSINGSVFTFTLAEQMLTTPGEIPVEINFYSSAGEKLTTFIFWLRVQASVLSDAEIISGDYYNVLTALVAEAVAAAERAEQAVADLPLPSDNEPAALGPAAPGSSARYSRSDHVHPMPSAEDVGALSEGTTPADIGAPAIPLHLTATITSLPATLSNTAITADMRVIECTFGTPGAIRSDVSWTTAAGSIVLSGTMSGSTTVDIILIETT